MKKNDEPDSNVLPFRPRTGPSEPTYQGMKSAEILARINPKLPELGAKLCAERLAEESLEPSTGPVVYQGPMAPRTWSSLWPPKKDK
jgi:hypothetical protein